ncbi:MAG: hypothetical protein ACKOC5_10605 [Chloroflexota bacterium]
MAEDKERKIIPSGGGLFNDIAARVKLVLRLMGDARVSPLLKLLPVGSLLYFLIPDLVIGPFDDVAIIWLGTTAFVEMCPPAIVEEHMEALRSQALPGEWRDAPPGAAPQARPPQDDVVEGEFWEKK